MAYNFGTGGQQSLFGNTSNTASSTGFGGFGSGLGTGTGTTGGFNFGGAQPSASQASTGFSFGAPASTSATTGFSFGAPAASSASTGFAFGAPAATSASTGFSFGAPAASASTGTQGFSFGAPSTASTGGFNFGTAPTTSAPSFGGFGGLGTTLSTGFGGFGTSTGFGGIAGSTFGAKPNFGFGQPQTFASTAQPQQPQHDQNALANLAMSVSMPQIFGDERDAIIARWNQVQACWGTGKGFFSQTGVVEYRPDNPFCRFKAVGYFAVPSGHSEDGQVAIILKRKLEEVIGAQQQAVDTITKILGRPNLSVCVEGLRPLPEDRTEVVIYVLERPPQGPAKRINTKELCSFLQQQTQWSQMTTLLLAEAIVPKVGWTPEQIREYLDTPPAGVDPLLWRQAKLDNPDPEHLVPVAMVGFKELQRRLKHQDEETRLHQQRMDVIAADLSELRTQHSQTLTKLEDYKRKHLELSHLLLKVIVKQEICRKLGYAVQPEEEMLKVQLEQLQMELNHPTQFKGRLNELMSQIRMQSQLGFGRDEPAYQMDANMQAEIRQILKQQQEGLQKLIEVIKEDTKDIEHMEQIMMATR